MLSAIQLADPVADLCCMQMLDTSGHHVFGLPANAFGFHTVHLGVLAGILSRIMLDPRFAQINSNE